MCPVTYIYMHTAIEKLFTIFTLTILNICTYKVIPDDGVIEEYAE